MKAKQKMSAEGRKRISEAQKARWAKVRKGEQYKAPRYKEVDEAVEKAQADIGFVQPAFTEVPLSTLKSEYPNFTSSQAQKKLDLIQQILNL